MYDVTQQIQELCSKELFSLGALRRRKNKELSLNNAMVVVSGFLSLTLQGIVIGMKGHDKKTEPYTQNWYLIKHLVSKEHRDVTQHLPFPVICIEPIPLQNKIRKVVRTGP